MFKKHSKIVALVLAMMLVVSMCCMSAYAVNPDGTLTDTQTVTVKTGDTVEYTMYIQHEGLNEGLQIRVSYGDKLQPTEECKASKASVLMPNLTVGSTIVNF